MHLVLYIFSSKDFYFFDKFSIFLFFKCIITNFITAALKCQIIFLKIFNVYFFERETEHEQGRGRERETQNLKQAPGFELLA